MRCPGCGRDNQPENRFCGHCGQELALAAPRVAEQERRASEGERRQVTVLFSDLSGFTAMTERLDPEEVKEIMGRIFAEIARIVNLYGGVVEKYIGDAAMALFGVSVAHEDDAVRAVRAAREIHGMVKTLSPDVERRSGRPIAMHSGINTGLVVTGKMDVEGGSMGVVGDTINVAARLTGLAGPDEIVVGPATQQLLERVFHCAPLPPAQLKGKEEAVTPWRIVGLSASPAAAHRFAGRRAALVGREKELQTLQRAMERLRAGEGSLITLCGEAGTGKSRLVEEFQAGLPAGVHWVQGTAHDYGRAMPFYPLLDMFSRAWGIEDGDPPERLRERIGAQIAGLGLEGDGVAPYLGYLFALEAPEIMEISPEYRKEKLLAALETVLRAMAARGPTVFFFEDLHWADPSTLELVRNLGERLPAVVLCAHRPPFRLEGSEGAAPPTAAVEEIELKGLSPHQSRDLARGLLDGATPPQGLLEFLEDRSAGNPFYLEEVLTSLIESEALVRRNGAWHLAGELSTFHVPPTIQGVIAARLDSLEPGNKRLLQEASVIGRTFLFALLHRITEQGENLPGRLESLERQELVRVYLTEPELEYLFKHPLTQEVVYGTLLRSERQAIHERVGQVMEELLADRLPEFYERLAHHFHHGHSREKAADYLVKSGEKAMHRYALHEAHQHFGQAYALLTGEVKTTIAETRLLFDLLDRWSYVFYYFGNFREQEALLRAHEARAASLEDPGREGMFHAWLGFALFFRGRMQESYDQLAQAISLGETAGDERVVGYACTWQISTCAALGRMEEAIAHGERARGIGERRPEDAYLNFKPQLQLSLVAMYEGDPERARRSSEEILDKPALQSNSRAQVMRHLSRGISFGNAGDDAAALAEYLAAERQARDPFYASFPATWTGLSRLRLGAVAEGRRDIERGLRVAGETGADFMTWIHSSSLGLAEVLEGKLGPGLKRILAVHGFYERECWRGNLLFSNYTLGKVYLEMVAGGERPTLSFLLRNLGFLLRTMPVAARRAEHHFGTLLNDARALGARGWEGRAHQELGNLWLARGKRERARAHLTEAVHIFQEIKAETYLQQSHETLRALGSP